MAVAFSMRPSSALATSALRRWHQVHTSHQNSLAFAVHYHSSQLRFRMLTAWRLQLRAKLKRVRHAKQLEKHFIVRNAWHKWIAKVQERKRERKLVEFEQKIAAKYFRGGWMAIALIVVVNSNVVYCRVA